MEAQQAYLELQGIENIGGRGYYCSAQWGACGQAGDLQVRSRVMGLRKSVNCEFFLHTGTVGRRQFLFTVTFYIY